MDNAQTLAIDGHLARLNQLASDIDIKGYYPKQWLTQYGLLNGFNFLSGDDIAMPSLIQQQTKVGKICLNTAFCAWCQTACAWYVFNSSNQFLKQHYLQSILLGKQLAGTGLSNPMKTIFGLDKLRLSGVDSIDNSGGYLINGGLPFVSNIEYGHLFAGVFSVNNTSKMALFDTKNKDISINNSAKFTALDGSATVNVTCRDTFIGEDWLIAEDASLFLKKIRAGFILLQLPMALGVITACESIIINKLKTKPWLISTLPASLSYISQHREQLEKRVNTLAKTPLEQDDEYFRSVLKCRLFASELSLLASQSAMLSSGAAGYIKANIANRKLRESFFVSIVTPSITQLKKMLQALP